MSNKSNRNLSLIENFFVPNAQSTHLDGREIVSNLIAEASNLTIAASLLFDYEDGELVCKTSNALILSMLCNIETKLKLINNTLPVAYGCSQKEEFEGSKA